MKLFKLVREIDVSGISGVGAVTEGVIFSDGSVAMRWQTHVSSVCFYKSIDDVIAIHGHDGATRVVYGD
jgi:hypothetical protein